MNWTLVDRAALSDAEKAAVALVTAPGSLFNNRVSQERVWNVLAERGKAPARRT